MGTKVYFFSSSGYARYDRGSNSADDGYPLGMSEWHGLPEAGFGAGIDTALNLESGKVFFFAGSQFAGYDVGNDRVDDGYPIPIATAWNGMDAAGFGAGLDAALNWGDGTVFFFKGDQYVRYNLLTNGVDDGYPIPIATAWNGMDAAGFGAGLDAALNWGDGTVFFFKGDQYVRYNMADNRVDDGYPLPIDPWWSGLSATLSGPIQAAIDLYDGRSLWIPNATTEIPPVNGPAYRPYPWRGVLHTTEGPTLSGALATFRMTNFWPTMTVEPKTLSIVQHYSLGGGARALSDHATFENAARCVQIEIVGLAAETPNWPPEWLAFIREVMRSIDDLVPIPRVAPRTFLDANGVSSTPANRMTVDEWARFSGWCGHQHVPGETHWDPGAIDVASLLAG